jgi:hypothetical protein
MNEYRNLSFYEQHKGTNTKTIDNSFTTWIAYIIPRLPSQSAAYGICRQIIQTQALNLTNDQWRAFEKYVLEIHVIKAPCGVCQNNFDWEEMIFADNMVGYGVVHLYCKERFEDEDT